MSTTLWRLWNTEIPKLLNITVNYVFINEDIVVYINILVTKDIVLNYLIHFHFYVFNNIISF